MKEAALLAVEDLREVEGQPEVSTSPGLVADSACQREAARIALVQEHHVVVAKTEAEQGHKGSVQPVLVEADRNHRKVLVK